VAIEYIAEPRDVTLDVNDVRLKRLETSVNNFITSNLVCPKTVKRGLKSITCTLSSNIFPFSDSNIQKLGYPPGSKVTLTGSELEYVVCVRAENWGGVACQNDLDLIPAYYAHIKSISLNVGQSVKFSVPNYLSKTGYTSIECGGPGCEEFGGEYEVKGYKSPDVRRATAVPTASEQKRIVGVIKKSMNERCQKLPSNFLSFQGKYVKRVTSQSGLYGYVFLLGSKVSIQIYEVGDIYWTFGPSPTKADNKTWESWGCGRTGIQTYG
jgi:hypothetical protein